eukprot:scaffold27476_cov28-Tisochrysis_lutea.AAC.1
MYALVFACVCTPRAWMLTVADHAFTLRAASSLGAHVHKLWFGLRTFADQSCAYCFAATIVNLPAPR